MCQCYCCRKYFEEAVAKYEPLIKERYSFARYDFGITPGESGYSHVNDSGRRIHTLFMRRLDNLSQFNINIDNETGEITDDLMSG